MSLVSIVDLRWFPHENRGDEYQRHSSRLVWVTPTDLCDVILRVDSKPEAQHLFVFLEHECDLMEATTTKLMALDASNGANLLLASILEHCALALHAEENRSDFLGAFGI